jgi:hypothetical protein
MHRLTARFLLLFALVGTFAPLAPAGTAAPKHACCLRKSVHQCHSPVSESDQRSISDTSCCNRSDGRRAVTTSQWAHAQPTTTAAFVQDIEARITESHTATPAAKRFSSQSTRAPPQISIA